MTAEPSVAELYSEGKSLSELAIIFAVTEKTITNRLKKTDIIPRRCLCGCGERNPSFRDFVSGHNSRLVDTNAWRKDPIKLKKANNKISKANKGRVAYNKEYIPPKEDLEFLYFERKLSANKIKDIMGVSGPTVKKWFVHYDIKTRGFSESVKNAFDTGVLKSSFSNVQFQQSIQDNRKKYNRSAAEKELFNLISEYFNCSHSFQLGRYNYDICIPEKKILIEYNGLTFHSEMMYYVFNRRSLEEMRKYHKLKSENATTNGYKCIHIWEDDWHYHKDRTKGWILSILGIIDKRIGARQTSISIEDCEVVKKFLNDNHLQGSANGSFSIVLRHKDEILACCLFSKSKDSYLLSRYCQKNRVMILGGFNKIIARYFKEFSLSITTFADLSWVSPHDNIYTRNGFKIEGMLNEDYKYIDKGIRRHKFLYRKKRLKSKFNADIDNLTEYDICTSNELYRIWDCGKIKYYLDP